MNEETQHLLTEAIKKYCKDNGKKYPGYASIAFEAGVNWGISNPIPVIQKEEAKTVEGKTAEILYMEGRQPFELYPNLAEHLQNAACHWKVDMPTWTGLLEEINIVCSQNKALMEENARLIKAIEYALNKVYTLEHTQNGVKKHIRVDLLKAKAELEKALNMQ